MHEEEIKKRNAKESPILFMIESLWRAAMALQLEWNRKATANTYNKLLTIDSLDKRSGCYLKQFKAI